MGKTDKGGAAEELLRQYFLSQDSFVVRGARFRIQDQDVTDVDLWVYAKPSRHSRERSCVDIKFKERPKALERVLWVKGLQSALRLERAIIATPDNRPIVKHFAATHGVGVIDGAFMSRLKESSTLTRLTQEELATLLDQASMGKMGGDWRGRVDHSRDRLIGQLNYDGCNQHLVDTKYFLEKATSGHSEGAGRALYLVIAHLLVTLDHILSGLHFYEPQAQVRALTDGLRYGKGGARRVDDITHTTLKLLKLYAPHATDEAKHELRAGLDAVRAEILSDYFLKDGGTDSLFGRALLFEQLAFARQFTPPSALDPSSKGMIGVLLDFHDMDRVSFFGSL